MVNKRFWLGILAIMLVCTMAACGGYEDIGSTGTYEDFSYWTNNDIVVINKYNGAGGAVTIPAQIDGKPVTRIGTHAFMGCTNLTSVTIPDSVSKIRYGAFMDCSNLTSITIPDNVTSIEGSAFYRCSKLASINIPDGVTSIESSTFFACTRLASVTIGNGVTCIGSSAFSGCSKLASITIPNSVISIGDYAFNNSSLTSVTIPDSVTSIWHYAFSSCTNLTSVTFQGTIDADNFGTYSFSGDLIDKYLARGIGTYTTTAPVGNNPVWTKW